ncbi:hypothetical protein, partial [Escherichia coli]|uniref:hypothetical protein n=1 Tax=Escherichia coli TaxID=562 RepID=UPI00248C9A11
FFCSLLAPSDAILFQEGVSVKLRLPQVLMIKGSNLVCSFPFHFPNQNPGKMNCLAEFLFSFYSSDVFQLFSKTATTK